MSMKITNPELHIRKPERVWTECFLIVLRIISYSTSNTLRMLFFFSRTHTHTQRHVHACTITHSLLGGCRVFALNNFQYFLIKFSHAHTQGESYLAYTTVTHTDTVRTHTHTHWQHNKTHTTTSHTTLNVASWTVRVYVRRSSTTIEY